MGLKAIGQAAIAIDRCSPASHGGERDLRVLLAQLARQFKAVHAWHAQVQQSHLRP
jgi:hypothetical protein